MPKLSLLHLLKGPFNFLRPEPEEIRALLPDAERWMPRPGVSFLEDESATPVRGFPVLISPRFSELRNALHAFLAAEEAVQVAVIARRPADRQALGTAWDRYRSLLGRAVENVTISSYGRNFPGIFWLQHSLDVARRIKEIPRRVVRLDLQVGREHGDTVKYRVLERYLDRVLTETYDQVSRLADDTDDVEEELFPRLLTLMRDNVIAFSEDHVGHDLAELGSYFHGYLRLDGRDLLQRLQRLAEWNASRLESDPELRSTVRHLMLPGSSTHPASAPDPAARARELLTRSGWVRYLSVRADYPEARLLSPALVNVWEGLLVKLKEFELIQGLRRHLLPVERDGGGLVCRAGAATRIVGGRTELRLSPATRPLDFMAPWVVDPQVHRFGLIYDLTDFSDIISVLRRSGSDLQDDSFRKMFRFQRRLNRLAAGHRMKLEKYLGDGAFYSGRHALSILVGGVQFQRAYRQAVAEGFPFDRGMRLALNYGQYRLIPIDAGHGGGSDRYEFFGHGLVELSRLISGKATREFEEIKTLLVALGYPEQTVYRFFSPLLTRNLDALTGQREKRTFYAAITAHGHLVNEGIVATKPFVAQLDRELPRDTRLLRGVDDDRRYVVVAAEEGGDRTLVGLRRMGLAQLKGLDRIPVYELVDGEPWRGEALEGAPGATLMEALERDLAEDHGELGDITAHGVESS